MKLKSLILLFAFALISSPVHAQKKAPLPGELTEGVLNQDEDTSANEDTAAPEDEAQFADEEGEEPAEQQKEEQAKSEEDQTEEITKDIVEEKDEPPAEFPYPGAKEEGYEKTQLEAQSTPLEITRPISISASGEYFYGFKSSPKDSSGSIRVGFFGPPLITNPVSNKTFEELYTNTDVPTLLLDYEKQLFGGFGEFGAKISSGFFVSTGHGSFVIESTDRTGRDPIEKYTFLMMPNTLTAIYRFQYSDTQLLVPYVEGGAGYFTFFEFRDDGKLKLGGAATGVAAAGLNILLDALDKHSIRQLDNDWGVNHVWLTAEFRLIQGLNKEYDFTSSVINGGVRMEF